MKKIIFLVMLLFIASNAMAHSGGTDRCGGHNNRKTGDYHIHNWAKYQACNPPKVEQKKRSLGADETIRKTMIKESISSYSGNCPCPHNRASNGSRCGKRSAWSRAGGYAPLCYKSDITDDMVKQYRKDQNL